MVDVSNPKAPPPDIPAPETYWSDEYTLFYDLDYTNLRELAPRLARTGRNYSVMCTFIRQYVAPYGWLWVQMTKEEKDAYRRKRQKHGLRHPNELWEGAFMAPRSRATTGSTTTVEQKPSTTGAAVQETLEAVMTKLDVVRTVLSH